MSRLSLTLLAVLCVSGGASAQVTTERISSNINEGTFLTVAPGDTERLFILERPGIVRIFRSDSLVTQPFLDIQSLVNSTAQEQGLLGLAFDPGYQTNGYFYLYYTGGTGNGFSTVQRYTVSANADSADPASAYSVFEITQPSNGHNGGTIEFGPSGYLYLSLGESNGQDRAQDPQNLLGKLLRLDVHGDDFPADSVQNYAVPPGNPFVGDPTTRDEIWALGLRNPWRFSFDRQTDDLYLADVGHNAWEEVNYEAAGTGGGQNYGWPLMEGAQCFSPPTGCDSAGTLTYPIHDYPHVAPSCWSITGGYVYRGSAIPALQGHYFFGDFCTGSVWTLRNDQGTVTEVVDRTTDMVPINGGFIWNVATFGQDHDGELYIIMYGTPGSLFRIIPDPAAVDAPSVAAGTPGLRLAASPNPFAVSTRVDVMLPEAADVRVGVYSASGRLVRMLYRGRLDAGATPLVWDGRGASGTRQPAGVYFLAARADGKTAARRVALVR